MIKNPNSYRISEKAGGWTSEEVFTVDAKREWKKLRKYSFAEHKAQSWIYQNRSNYKYSQFLQQNGERGSRIKKESFNRQNGLHISDIWISIIDVLKKLNHINRQEKHYSLLMLF